MASKIVPPPPPTRGTAWEPFALPCVLEGKDGATQITQVMLKRYPGPVREGVPALDPYYVFRAPLVRELAWATWPHDGGLWTPSLLVGPKGCGKTSLVLQVAARCNVPVMRVNLNVGTTVRHLKGRVGAEDGGTMFVPGVATIAMETGAWLILDEVSGATPPVALSLFPILEPNGDVLLEDAQPPRYVKRHSDFRVFATDNTIGAEQEDSRFAYGGTNPEVNEALLDRFGSTIQIGYMPQKQEHEAIQKIVPGIADAELEGMIRVAHNIRQSNAIATAFSFRMLVEWARRVSAGRAMPDGSVTAFDSDREILAAAGPAFLNKIRSKVERDTIVEVIRRLFAIKDEVPL